MKLDITPEICCDICNEVIHNHFTCPICGIIGAETNRYLDLYEMEIGEVLECEKCNAAFKLISKSKDLANFEWELIKDGR